MTRRIVRFAALFLLFAASAAKLALAAPVGAGVEVLPDGDVRVQGSGTRPQLFFACELDTPALESFFSDPAVVANLKELNAGVALATKDLSPGRARVVRQLNEAGIPVIAWIVLPREQGYYVNAADAAETAARFDAIEKWTVGCKLQWAAVGLDIEPDLNDFTDIREHKLRFLGLLLRRAFDVGRVRRARQAYSALATRIRSAGYPVQSYQLMFLADEREVRTSLLERFFGIVDLRAQSEEVLMIYSSFNHQAGAAMVWTYGPDAEAIAVGSTSASGDPKMDAKFPPLNWDEFSRDLTVASHFSRIVGVYSLEGCVQQGFLPRLKALDWRQTVTISAGSIRKMTHFRHAVEAVLWLLAHLLYFAGASIVLIAVLIWRRRSRRNIRIPPDPGARSPVA